MPQDGVLSAFGVADAKISRLLTDPIGGTATYGPAIDVPGIQSVSFNPDFMEKELRGDNKIIDQYAKVESVSGSIKHAKISMPVLAILMGGDTVDSGVSPNEKKTYTLKGSDKPSYWMLQAQIDYRGGEAVGGDYHVTFFKAKVSKFSQEYQSEDYAVVSFDFKAIPRDSDDSVFSAEENETAIPLEVGASDSTPPTVTLSSPADGATNVAVNASVVWTMSEALQGATVNPGSVMLVNASDGTNVAGTVTLNNAGAGTTVTLHPTGNLDAATDYIAFLTTSVRDAAGNALAAPSVVNFQTA